MKKQPFILLLTIVFLLLSCNQKAKISKDEMIEKKIDSLLVLMTLEEKIGQMQQLSISRHFNDTVYDLVRQGKIGSFLNARNLAMRNELQRIALEESRLRIPLIFGRDVIHGYKTIFPIPLGQAASWNPVLVEKASAIAAKEASSDGIDWTFAPMLDIARDPRWGRIAESPGEDPFLASMLARAMVRGFQGEDLTDPSTIAACGKHFVGYGAAEGGKDYNTTLIPEAELRNIYLPSFKAFVEEGGQTIMSAFNDLNGIPTSGNEFTLRQILRNEWRFDGFVVSDWESVAEMIPHGYCKDEAEAAQKAILAGVDMEMVSQTMQDHLPSLIQNGTISESFINLAVKNILRVKFRLGLFEKPYADSLENVILTEDNLKTAREIATESCVLLKNEDNVLPIKSSVKRIAVIGPLADAPLDQLGTWAFDGRPENSVTPLKAFQEMSEGKKIIYSPGLKTSRDKDMEGIKQAVAAARQSDIVLLFLGEEAILSGEAHSRAFLNLPGAQEQLVEALTKTGKPLVGIILAGRPLVLSKIEDKLSAILYAWHPGTMAGPAIHDLVFGKVVPSGKLPVSFPRAEGQIPVYYNHKNTGRPPREEQRNITPGDPMNPVGFSANYLDLDYLPRYPFGYGLSYTSFDYSNILLSADTIGFKDTLDIEILIKNTGAYDAQEIVQLYIRDIYASITQPVKELKGFKKIMISAGDSLNVNFGLTVNDLSFYDNEGSFLAEPGRFELFVGKNSRETIKASFYLK
ncbi:MAG: beta-glucosidase BglX [Bacteroidales bacterium]|nr:beta-glucosidase BglX [Bacteroidales bacterium]